MRCILWSKNCLIVNVAVMLSNTIVVTSLCSDVTVIQLRSYLEIFSDDGCVILVPFEQVQTVHFSWRWCVAWALLLKASSIACVPGELCAKVDISAPSLTLPGWLYSPLVNPSVRGQLGLAVIWSKLYIRGQTLSVKIKVRDSGVPMLLDHIKVLPPCGWSCITQYT